MCYFLQVFYSVFSSILLALSIPNEILTFGSAFIGLIANVPIYVAINKSKSYKEAFWLCFLHGFFTHIFSSFWLGNFQGYAIFTLGASSIGTGFVEAFLSLFFYFPILFDKNRFSLKHKTDSEDSFIPFKIIWFTSLYTVWEWIKSTGFLGYPWGTVSMTAFQWTFITQIADLTGPYGITFLFTFCSALVGEGLLIFTKRTYSIKKSNAFKNTTKAFLSLMLLANFYGFIQYITPREPIKSFNAILVQQNGDPWQKGEELSIEISKRLTEEKITELKNAGKTCDLVVWSEAVLRKRFPNAQFYYDFYPEDEPLLDFIDRMNSTFIIGAPYTVNFEKHLFSNSAILFNKDGQYCGAYQKMHLVPFAELIPGAQFERIQKIMKGMVGFSYGWYPGQIATTFEIPIQNIPLDARKYRTISIVNSNNITETPKEPKKSVVISTPICFDDTAAEVCRALFLTGSEVFINITNDAWSKTKSAEIQHMVVAHYRAIEYRTTLARCTNAGYTVVINPVGKILDSLPLFEECALATTIPVYEREITIYAKLGNWLPMLLALLSIVYVLFTLSNRTDKIIVN